MPLQVLFTHSICQGQIPLLGSSCSSALVQKATVSWQGAVRSTSVHISRYIPSSTRAPGRHCHFRRHVNLREGSQQPREKCPLELMARHKLHPRRVIIKPSASDTDARFPSHIKPRITAAVYPPTELFTSEHGVRAEVLRIGSLASPTIATGHSDGPNTTRNASEHTHVVVLPGNPCVIEYYRPLLRMIHQRLPFDVRQHTTIHALGLPGHDLRNLNGTSVFKISDHLDYCLSYLHADVMFPALENSKIIIIGHSYGSYLGLRLLEALDSSIADRASVAMLMPALYRMAECAGMTIRFLLQDRFWSTTSLLWAVTSLTPPAIRRAILASLNHDKSLSEVSERMVDGHRRGLYLNICRLARDETVHILHPEKLAMTKKLNGRALLVHADNDQWCPPVAVDSIVATFGDKLTSVWAGNGVGHAFVLSRKETETVVKIVVPWLVGCIRGES